jgi:hypothetical protein
LVHQDELGVVGFGAQADFVGFAGPDEILRIGPGARGQHQSHAHRSGGRRQGFEFSRVIGIDRMADAHSHQDGAFASARAFKQLRNAARSLDDRRFRDFAVLAGGQPDVAGGHHRRNGMFVDHLAYAVPEQYHELIERIDLSLQLDAVHQIDRNGHAFFAQGIQERVLQRLATGHE